MNTNAMTKGERTDLLKVVRARERLAKTEVKEQAATLKADFEQQLDTTYSFNSDEVWSQADKIVEEAASRNNSLLRSGDTGPRAGVSLSRKITPRCAA